VAVVDSLGGVDVNVAHASATRRTTSTAFGRLRDSAPVGTTEWLAGARLRARPQGAASRTSPARPASRRSSRESGCRGEGWLPERPIGFLKAIGQTVQTNVREA